MLVMIDEHDSRSRYDFQPIKVDITSEMLMITVPYFSEALGPGPDIIALL